MNDNDLMPFGKYEGQKLANVPARYLLWLDEEGIRHQALNAYVQENKDVLEQQCRQDETFKK